MNSYTKLSNGSWGVRVIGTTTPGARVTVQTKAGQVKTETVTKVLWTGADKWKPGQTISLCAIEPRSSSSSDSYGNRIGNGDSYRAGVTAPHGRKCPHCGSRECSGAWGDLCDED